MDLLRSLPLGLYLEQPQTWLHRLDLRVKLAWLMLFLVTPVLSSEIWRLGLLGVLLAIALASGVPWRSLKAQAGWLAAAAERATALVWMQHGPELVWPLLRAQPAAQLVLQPPITPAELRAELAGAPLSALAEDRPTPPLQELHRWERPAAAPLAAVLVSLYNYADRITAALNSVAAQRQQQLELIVVDDASTDTGAAVVQAWMKAQEHTAGSPFARLLLLRHGRNAGLATARNTAFAAAQAPWCFVLDADNALLSRSGECLPGAHSTRLATARGGASPAGGGGGAGASR